MVGDPMQQAERGGNKPFVNRPECPALLPSILLSDVPVCKALLAFLTKDRRCDEVPWRKEDYLGVWRAGMCEACTGHAGRGSTEGRSQRISFTWTHWLEDWTTRHHQPPHSVLTPHPPHLCKRSERLSWEMFLPFSPVRKPEARAWRARCTQACFVDACRPLESGFSAEGALKLK